MKINENTSMLISYHLLMNVNILEKVNLQAPTFEDQTYISKGDKVNNIQQKLNSTSLKSYINFIHCIS